MYGDKKEQAKNVSPIEMYVEWKKNKETGESGFYTYNKELGGEVKLDIEEFVIIDESYQIKGFDKKTNKYLRSNIIANKKTDELVVNNDGNEVFRGIWNPDLKPAWATMYKVVTVVTDGTLVRLTLKPSVAQEFTKMFVKETDADGKVTARRDYNDRYEYMSTITGTETKESQFGPYVVPLFKLGKKLTEKQKQEVTVLANIFRDYVEGFKTKEEDNQEELPF